MERVSSPTTCGMHKSIPSLRNKAPRVLIIGAGFSGLAAGRTILRETKGQSEWDVTIIEASDRVGGRAKTVEVPDVGPIEMGAQWMHGIVGNPIYDLAKRCGLLDKGQQDLWIRNSRMVLEGRSDLLSREEESVAQSAMQEFAKVVDEVGESDCVEDVSLGHFLSDRFKKLKVESGEVSSSTQSLVNGGWLWRETLQRSIDGSFTSWDNSARGALEYEELKGGNVLIPGGYQNVARQVAEGLNISYGCVVEKVHWGDDGVIIDCANGQQFKGDFVIVSLPLGVLKHSHQKLFTPPLPDSKISAIEKLGFGVVDKIFLHFTPDHEVVHLPESESKQQTNKPVHDTQDRDKNSGESSENAPETVTDMGKSESSSKYNARFGSLGSENKGDENVSYYMLLWEASCDEAEQLSLHPVGLSKEKSEKESVREWMRGLFVLHKNKMDKAKSQGGRNFIASMWIGGDDAIQMENLHKDAVHDIFPKLKSHFPAIKLPPGTCECPTVYRTTWGTDPLFRGSYSYIAVGSTGDDIDALAEPLELQGRPVVMFCGEATHRQYFSTAHGAYMTGEREAMRLVNWWKSQ